MPMSALDPLDSTAMETMVRFLSFRFRTKVPRLHITNRRANGGMYFKRRIRVSRNAEAWIVMHEFAHHLDRETNGRRREPHNEVFFYNLKRVIEAVGCTDYPWQKEYKQLGRWASRETTGKQPQSRAERQNS